MNINEYFSKFETRKYQDRFFLKRFLIKRFLRSITENVAVLRPKNIFEAGCGEGFVSGYLSVNFPDIDFFGLDQDKTALVRLNRLFPRIKTFQHDLEIPVENQEKYDLVMAIEVLEHLAHPDEALKNLNRLTKKYLIVSVPWEPAFSGANFLRGKNLKKMGRDKEHINFWNKGQIAAIIARYFKIVKTQISFPWTIVIAEKK